MPKILAVQNLTVTLDDETILEDVSFDLDEGDNLALIGPNGSGKTVLLKTLLGTLPHSGNIVWAPNTRPGYVPQKVDADRHLPMTFQNLLEAKTRTLGLKRKEMDDIVKTVGIDANLLQIPVGHLSGGQFQKALVAFALLGQPNVLLLDEPTASLDQPREEQVYELIHRMQDEYGLTILLVSHDLNIVYRYATKVLCLNKRNLCFGTPEETLTPENLQKLYATQFKYYHHIHNNHESESRN